MAPQSSTLAWKIPWMEEPGRLQSMGSLRVKHDWATSLPLFTFIHWRRKLQPAFTGNLRYKLCRNYVPTQRYGAWIFHSPTSTSHSSSNNTQLVSPSPCITSSKDKSKVTLEAKDTKAQENVTSENVSISAPSLPSPASYLKSCESKELHESLHVSIRKKKNQVLIYIGV